MCERSCPPELSFWICSNSGHCGGALWGTQEIPAAPDNSISVPESSTNSRQSGPSTSYQQLTCRTRATFNILNSTSLSGSDDVRRQYTIRPCTSRPQFDYKAPLQHCLPTCTSWTTPTSLYIAYSNSHYLPEFAFSITPGFILIKK